MSVSDELQALVDHSAVVAVVVGIANAFDRKDWPRLRSFLAAEIYTDYSQFRGEAPSYVAADAYVAARQAGLEGLQSLHISTNHEVSVDGDTATCYSSYRIFRVLADNPSRRLDTAGTYRHRLERVEGRWLVTHIEQTVVVLDGDPSIHGALRDGGPETGQAT
jgi:hypothetical protein